MPRISELQRDALTMLASREHGAQVGKRPLTMQTLRPLAQLGLVTIFEKTVVGVTITKAALTEAGREVVKR